MRVPAAGWTVLIMATSAAILLADIYTPPAVQLAALVVLPVVLASWRFGMLSGVALALILLAIRIPWHVNAADPVFTLSVAFGNFVIRGASFALVAVLTAHVRSLHDSLSQSNAKLQYVRAASNDAVWIENLKTGMVEVNARWASWLGPSVADGGLVPISGLEEVLHPDDRAAVASGWASVLEGTKPHAEGEFRLRRTDGGWSWVLGRGTVIERDGDGRALRAAGVITDVSAFKQVEAQLRADEARFHAFFDSPAVGAAIVGRDDRFEVVNDRLCQILGYPREELMGLTFSEVTHPDDRTRHDGPIRSLAEGKVDHFILEKRYLRKDGSVVWGFISVGAVRAKGGGFGHRMVVLTDVTARKAAEDATARTLVENQRLVGELTDALEHVKTLSGLIPNCANCKKIRDDQGFWQRIESYLAEHTDATFTHGICPDCVRKLYPDYADGVLGHEEVATHDAHRP
jgi:PAS domain S-box-containing protein